MNPRLMLQTEIKAVFSLNKPEGEDLSPEEQQYLAEMDMLGDKICDQLQPAFTHLFTSMFQFIMSNEGVTRERSDQPAIPSDR